MKNTITVYGLRFTVYSCFFLFSLTGNWKLETGNCLAQAYQMTQFYAAPVFLNPAFAGADACARLTTNYRMQWPSIPGGFRTYLLAFDHRLARQNSGIGFLFTNDKAGSGNLRATTFNAQYSYQLQLTRKWGFNAGFEAGYAQRNYDFNKFIFGDQIAYGTTTSVEQPLYDKVRYLDLSSGMLLYSDKSWIGFATHHLNQPNQALVSDQSHLPILYSVHGGMVIPITSKGTAGKVFAKHSITPAINYRAEKEFDQVDVGCYYSFTEAVENIWPGLEKELPKKGTKSYASFVAGVWYRGIPILKAYKTGYPNNDAFAFLLGMTIDRFKFGYSYDLTISGLAGYTAGAHELSICYQFCDPNATRKRKSAIPCPKF
ncbi:MAG: type IX secretion system membrane protein PorP/SprF [Bacteroidetes bacterium]|nr:type IX secretion system membrane protein PorP/SprF [Bacteroidota bacterium]